MNLLIKSSAIVAIAAITSCSGERKRSNLTYDSNTENNYWKTTNAVEVSDKAHSGNYLSRINKNNPFSLNFEAQLKKISDKPLSKAYISAYIMLTGFETEQNLVLEIRDSTGEKTVEWLNVDAGDYIDEPNKWVKIDNIIDLTINNRNNPNNFYRVYATNGKEGDVFVDDFMVEFE